MKLQTDTEKSLAFLLRSSDFVELQNGPDFLLDLRYASKNNFVGVDMYGPFRRAFLHVIAAEKLFSALSLLRRAQPRFKFVIFDALRPRSIQHILWRFVVGTEAESYIANPEHGSLHNFGFAVDLSIIDEDSRELEMGAGYDDFRPIAHPRLENDFLQQGLLTQTQVEHRRLLRSSMELAGFTHISHEWWHFDAITKNEARARFQIVE